MNKGDINKMFSEIEHLTTKKDKKLIKEFKKVLFEIYQLKDLMLSERAQLKDQLDILTEKRLEYENMITALKSKSPTNLYM